MSDAVEVCPECDIADCRHIRSRRDISRITALEAQLAAKDALIRDLATALRMSRLNGAWDEHPDQAAIDAALTRAKEVGYE